MKEVKLNGPVNQIVKDLVETVNALLREVLALKEEIKQLKETK